MKLLKGVVRTAVDFLIILAFVGSLEGATTWTGGDGDWATPGNWDAGLPASDIDAIIGLTRDVAVNSDQTVKSLTINGGSTVALSLSPSSTLTLNAGGTYVPALFVNDNSTLNLSDGTIKVALGQIFIGGTSTNGSGDGTVNMSGGVFDFDEVTSGSYAYMVVGRNGAIGAFNQSGGEVITGGALMIGLDSGTGNYNLSGSASLATGDTWNGTHIYIGLTQSGGQTGTQGTLTISDNATFTVGGHSYLHIGDNLDGGAAYAGGSGKIVQQDNSTVTLGGNFLLIGSSFGGTGEYDLEGGSLTISATTATIAAEAGSTGILNQTGGTLTIAAGHALNFGSGTGTYNLNGGTLEIGGSNPIGGAGTFNFGAATIKATTSLVENLDLNITADSTNTAVFDTNGQSVALGGDLNGSGYINFIGGGTVTFNNITASANTRVGGLGDTASANLASGSTLTIANDFRVGNLAGTGYLTLAAGQTIDLNSTAASPFLRVGAGVDSQGTFTITGGTVDADKSYFTMLQFGTGGGFATINQSGGVVKGGTNVFVGYGGTGAWTLSGNAEFQGTTAGASSFFDIGVGYAGGPIPSGTLNINDNAKVTFGSAFNIIALGGRDGFDYEGNGTINQNGTGSEFSIAYGLLMLGYGSQNTGYYNLNGGVFNIDSGDLRIGEGVGAGGAFTQTGGSATIGAGVLVGSYGSGAYSISGGSVVFENGLTLAVQSGSTGTFTQTGGTVTISAGKSIAFGAGDASYDLAGGTLEVGGTNPIGIGGDFKFDGGTIKVTGSALTEGAAATLTAGTSSTLDTNGFNATWSGALSGSGALLKTGAGTLRLNSASDSAIGLLAITAGTASISSGITADGASFIPQAPFYENASQREAIYVNGGAALSLESGADVAVKNDSNLTAFLRVGYGTSGSLNIADGAALSVGQSTRYANFQIGQGIGATGTVTQDGGAVSVRGSFNVGVNGGTGVYTINGGTLTLDHADDAGHTSLFDIGLNLTHSGTSSGLLEINGGLVEILPVHGGNSDFIIGNREAADPAVAAGNGTVTQTGGIFRLGTGANLYLSSLGNGTYNLSGGTLEIGGASLREKYGNAGAGVYAFNLGGGTIKVAGSDLTTSISANLIEGGASTIDTNGFDATWSGNLIGQGDHQIDWGGSSLTKQGAGKLTFSGSSRVLDTFAVTGGTVRQTAGATSSVEFMTGSGNGSTAEYILDGGSILVSPSTKASNGAEVAGTLRVGDFGGVGTFTQNAGSVTLADNGAFNIGNQGGAGTYNLNGGTVVLNSGNHVIGRSDTGKPDSHGSLNIAGGTLTVQGTGALIIGNNLKADGSTGELTQTGGVLHVDNDSSLWLSALSQGVYNLNGGTLEIGGSSLFSRYPSGTASANFNLGGGTIKVIGSSLTTSAVPTLTAATTSTVNTNGFNATFSSNIAGPGTLHKTGAGTLNLNGAGTAAQIVVVEGVLSGTGSTTGGILVQSGATLAGKLQAGGVTEIAAGGTFSPGFSPAAVYNSGSLTLDGTLYLEIGGTNGVTSFTASPVTGQYDQLLYEGAIELGSTASIIIEGLAGYTPQEGDTFNLLLSNTGITIDPSVSITLLGTLGGYAFDLDPDGNTLSLTIGAIPEPSPIVLAMLGLTGFGLIRRVRRIGKKLRPTI